MAGERLDECTDQEIEEFLWKSRALVIQLLPEPDDFDAPTTAGFVSTRIMHDIVLT